MFAGVQGLFAQCRPGGEVSAGQQGLLARAVGGQALFELDLAADAAGVGGQAGDVCCRVRVVLFEGGDDVLVGLPVVKAI